MAVDVEILSTDISQLTNGMDEVVRNSKKARDSIQDFGDTIDKELKNSTKDVKEFDKALADTAKGFDNAGKSSTQAGGKINQAFTSIKTGAKAVGAAIAAAFAFTAIIAGIKELITFQKELQKTRRAVNQLTGTSGKELNRLTAAIKSTADTFGRDFNEVLIASNALSEQLGITQEQAIDKIQKGFVIGADASSEFLDILREYGPQFNEIGLTADQAIAVISRQVEQGVFSDKGVDALKEVGERLGRLEEPALKALNAIGLSGTKIQQELQSGQTTVLAVTREVSEQIAQLPENSTLARQAIDDIFGTPGVDAGRQFIESLATIPDTLEEAIDKNNAFQASQLKLVEANEELELAFNRLFGSADGVFDSLLADAKLLLADGINALIDGVISAANFFIELYNQSTIFRAGIQLIGLQFKNTFEVISLGFNIIIDQFKTVFKVIAAGLRGDFDQIGNIIKDSFSELKNDITTFGKDVAQSFVDAFKNTIEPQKIDLINLDADAEKAGENAGDKGGKAFVKGFTGQIEKEIRQLGADIVDSIVAIDTDEVGDRMAKDVAKALEKSKKDLEDLKDAQDQLPNNFLFRVLGINIDDEDFAGLALAVNEVTNAIANAANERIEASQRELDAIDENINQTRDALDEQLLLQEEGKANSVDLEKQKLTELNAARAEALDEQQRAVSIQQSLDTIQQAGSIATASANILKGFSTIPIVGPALGIAAVAGMIFSFIQSKIRARQAASFFKGGEYSDLGGYTGNISPYQESTLLGEKPYTYHGNEFIFNADATKKHAAFFHALHNDSLSHLSFENPTIKKILSEVPGMDQERINKTAIMVSNQGNPNDTKGLEKRLSSIESKMEKYFDNQSSKPDIENLADGTRIIRTKNRTRIIRK